MTTPDAWKQCNGKMVRMKGVMAGVPMQHPLVPQSFKKESETPPGSVMQHPVREYPNKKKYQTYVNVPMGQIVLTSGQKIDCQECIEFDGTAEVVSLGGTPGTKGEYENLWVAVAEYQCVPCG
jgi:hypothetical protein